MDWHCTWRRRNASRTASTRCLVCRILLRVVDSRWSCGCNSRIWRPVKSSSIRGDGSGIVLATTERATLKITLNDGRSESGWDCDQGVLQAGRLHHVVVTVDDGPKIISFVVDGVLCDGAAQRQFGWGRFSPHLGDVSGAAQITLAPTLRGEIKVLRVYNRFLRTSEAVGNFRAGRNQPGAD